MPIFRDRPIRVKLQWVIAVTTILALTTASIVIIAYQWSSYRQVLMERVAGLGSYVAINSTVELAFNDAVAAREHLALLKSNPEVVGAWLYTTEGELLAEYRRADSRAARVAKLPDVPTGWFEGHELVFSHPVRLRGEIVGTLVMRADMQVAIQRRRNSILVVLACAVLAGIVATLAAYRLQRVILDPIEELSRVTEVVAQQGDYSVRATPHGKDELGRFTIAFNEMLWQLQQRDKLLEDKNAQQAADAERLRLSEERFRQLVGSIREVFWMTTVDKQDVLYVSPGFESIWGRSCESLVRAPESWVEAIHPEDCERVRAALPLQVEGRYDVEYRVVRPDGTVRWVHDRAFPIPEENGAVYRVAGIAEDISETKRAQIALQALNQGLERSVQERTAQLRLALEASQAGTWSWEADTNTARWDEQYRLLYGFRPDQPTTQELWLSALHPEDRPRVAERMQQLMQPNAGDRWAEDFRVLHPTKGVRWMNALGRIERDSTGRAVRFSGINLDITARKEAEAMVRRSEAVLRSAFDNAPFEFWVRDRNGVMIFENAALAQHWGSLLGQRIEDAAVEPATLTIWQENNRRVYAGEIIQEEVQFTQSGETRWMYNVVAPLRVGAEIQGILGYNIDITDRKQSEAKIQKLNNELEQRVRDRTAKLEQALNAVREGELRLRQIARGGNVGFWDWDLKTNKVFFSAEWKSQIGYAEHEISDDFEEWQQRVHPDDLTRTMAAVQDLVKQPRPSHGVEFRFRHKNGTYRWILSQASVLMDAEGKLERMLGTHVDVTALKEVDAALRVLHAEQQTILNSVPSLIWYKDKQNRIIRLNQSAAALAGKTVEEIEGHPTEEFYPDEAGQYYRDDLEVLRSGKPKLGIVEKVPTASGEKRWVQTDKVPFRNAQGEIVGIIVCSTDITARLLAEEKLRLAEERYRLLVERVPAVTYTAEPGIAGRWHYISPQVEPLLGFKVEEWLNDPGLWYRQVHPDDRDRVILTEQSEPYRIEYRLMGKDQRVIWVRDEGVFIRQEGAVPLLMQGVIRNVTARKEAELALRDSEERYRMLVDAAPDVIYTVAPDTTVTSLSRAFEATLGWQREEWVNRSFRELIHEGDLPVALRALSRTLRGERLVTFEIRIRSKSRGYVHAEIIAEPLIRDSRIIGSFGIARDITARRETEAALQEARQNLQNIYDSSEDAIVYTNLAGDIVDFNRAYERLTGYSAEELRKLTYQKLTPPEYWELEQQVVQSLLAGGPTARYEKQYFRADGSRVPLAMATFLVRDPNGKPTGLAAVIRDVTTQRRMEQQILEISDREQRRIGQDLHDGICQVLTGTSFAVKTLEERLLAAGGAGVEEARDIANLLQQANADVRRVARGLHPAALDFGGLIPALQELSANSRQLFGVTCRLTNPPENLPIDVARDIHVYRVIQEAIVNAGKHGRARQVEIKFSPHDHGLSVEIIDDGTGLPEHLEPTQGMGLNIMAYRARAINGTLQVQRRATGGAVVQLTFPVRWEKMGA